MNLRPVIGVHACREALKARASKELKSIYFKVGWDKSLILKALAKMAKRKKMDIKTLSEKKLNQIGLSHQGVCLFTSGFPHLNLESLSANSVILILDRIQDPKNLGAIIRTSWLMGVDALFLSSRHSVPLNASVAKSACGGLEYVPIEIRENLPQCIKELKQKNFWFYALDFNSNNNLWKEKFEGRTAFVFGGEESGIRKGLKKVCDKSLSISQKQKEASYNVSVAAALTLGEYFRQRILYV